MDKYADISDKVSPNHDLVARLGVDDKVVSRYGYATTSELLCGTNRASAVTSAGRSDAVEDNCSRDGVLEHISQVLMEEDAEHENFIFHEPSLLEAAERSLYEAIGGTYVWSPDQCALGNYTKESPNGSSVSSGGGDCGDELAGVSGGEFIFPGQNHEVNEHILPAVPSKCGPSVSSYNTSNAMKGHSSSYWRGSGWVPELTDGENRFDHDANEFLPLDNNDILYSQSSGLANENREEAVHSLATLKENGENLLPADGSRRKENPLMEEAGIRKQLLRYSESGDRSEMFDKILLCSRESEAALRQAFQNLMLSPTKGKDRGKKGQRKRKVVDLRTPLMLCAQAVSIDDRRGANDLLKQIRQHASPTGDGMQRLAHYFANGLEARLAGYGTDIYNPLIAPTPVVDMLKVYHLYVATCPFRKMTNYFSNKTITNLAEKSEKVHIVDFGGTHGFQWPSLIQRLSSRASGPPKLRLTAINLPQPGFRPAEGLEATGRRLLSYAEGFNVPFEYEAIAAKWDEVKIEDIKIKTDEVTIANRVYRLEDLDESVVEESPRDVLLNLIRKINPRVFIQGVVNGGHGSPFFISRFREALFYYSAFFDMLDTTVPRDNPERTLLELEGLGRKAMNVIACEGSERIDRPETYKKWHLRNLRAGFAPLPLDQEMANEAKDKLRCYYHKNFEIEEDGCWLLQGWKGRIVHALSTWKPATSI